MRFPSLPSKSATFWILMAASAVSALILPPAWTRWGREPPQAVAIVQMPVAAGARATAERVARMFEPTIGQAEARQFRDRSEELRRQVEQQRLRIQDLERQLADVTGLRGQVRDKQYKIVVAPVAAYDADPRRDTLLVVLPGEIGRRLVRPKQWVLALGQPSKDWDEIRERAWLIGRVCEVHTQSARVELTTCATFRGLPVVAAGVAADGTWQFGDRTWPLAGLGGGKMVIRAATEDCLATGRTIVVTGEVADLAMRLSIGRIVTSRPLDESPQHYDLTVVPWRPMEELSHVYILSAESLGP